MELEGTRVIILGAARQGTALARYLANHNAQVVLTDLRTADALSDVRQSLAGVPVEWVLGEHPLSLLDGADVVCPSGGVPLTIPLIQAALSRGIPLSNDSQFFMEAARCPVIGITGSAGKTTTTTLIGRMAEAAAKQGAIGKAFIGGNIGYPLIAEVDQMAANDLAVMELSSFQLDVMTSAPNVAVLLNITPNHLDRHGTMEAYIAAKGHILAYQTESDSAVLGYEDPSAWALASSVKGKLWAFGRELPEEQIGTFIRQDGVWLRTEQGETEIMPMAEITLRGAHNVLNVLAACAAAAAAGLPPEAMRAGVHGFGGVEHRLEFVRQWGGAAWYNDSKATSPGMTITAMRAFEQPLVLLVGGRDKHLPWDEFAQEAKSRVDHMVAFGEAAEIIESAVKQVKGTSSYSLEICAGLDQAVAAAAQQASPGDVVLLAPGGTSFDEFSDYEARGRRFKELVQALPEKE